LLSLLCHRIISTFLYEYGYGGSLRAEPENPPEPRHHKTNSRPSSLLDLEWNLRDPNFTLSRERAEGKF
jgi:hypothetical protein